METVVLTAVISLFLPFLLKLGGKTAEKATETAAGKFGEVDWGKVQAVWRKLSPTVEDKEEATDVAKNPEGGNLQAAFRTQLKSFWSRRGI